MKLLICVPIYLFLFLHGPASSQPLDGSVTAEVNLNSNKGVIDVRLIYKVFLKDSSINKLTFYLAKDCKLKSITGPDLLHFSSDSATRPERSIILNFKRQLPKNASTEITYSYELPYDSARYRKYNYIELGLDWFWFPVHPKINEWKINFDLLVKTDNKDLNVFSNGKVTKVRNNLYRIASVFPDFDIDLFFLKDAAIFTSNRKDIKLVGNRWNPSLKDSIAKLTTSYIDFYNKMYKTNISNVTCIFRPGLAEPGSFGYARTGYFVLNEPAKLADVKFFIAHELAHLWFLHGEPTENAWLTESFAEYNAMLATKSFDGDSAFHKIIKDKEERIKRITSSGKALPPVYKNGSKGKSIPAQIALYHRGPLILHELHKLIGNEKMEIFLNSVTKNKLSTTSQVLDILEKITNRESKDIFREKLTATTQ